MDGSKLIETIASATGLPEMAVQKELLSIVQQSGKDPDNLTLDDLRELLAMYLQEVLLSACREHS